MKQAIGEIDLLTCAVKEARDSSKNYCFEIITPTKSFVLQAESGGDMNRWLKIISNNISRQISTHQAPPLSKTLPQPEENAPINSGNRALSRLYQQKERNRFCADCLAKGFKKKNSSPLLFSQRV